MKERKQWSTDTLLEGVMQGDRTALGKAITVIESTREKDREAANQLIETCLPYSGSGQRIGISGAPGSGKSTFIEAYGRRLTEKGQKVAVLAIDPSSGIHHGSILGDKTRMERLARDPNAFIRPSPSGTTLGGVARKTRETILLCEAAGYQQVLIETVGVGQSETAVQAMTDLFVLLLIPGAGDSLQGIKRGIVEMADLILVNKADGDRLHLAEEARLQYSHALHLYPPKPTGQPVQVLKFSALEGLGMDEVVQSIHNWLDEASTSGSLEARRTDQQRYWLKESLLSQLSDWYFSAYADDIATMESNVLAGKISPFMAAEKLMKLLKNKK